MGCRDPRRFLRILCLRNSSWIPKQESYELRSEMLTYACCFVFVNTATADLRRYLRIHKEFFVYEMLHEYQKCNPTNFAAKSWRTNVLLCSWIRPLLSGLGRLFDEETTQCSSKYIYRNNTLLISTLVSTGAIFYSPSNNKFT